MQLWSSIDHADGHTVAAKDVRDLPEGARGAHVAGLPVRGSVLGMPGDHVDRYVQDSAYVDSSDHRVLRVVLPT